MRVNFQLNNTADYPNLQHLKQGVKCQHVARSEKKEVDKTLKGVKCQSFCYCCKWVGTKTSNSSIYIDFHG